MRLLPVLAGLAAVFALAGCAALQSGPGPTDAVVAEALRAARTPAAEQKATLLRAQEAFAADGGALNRLRLATLLVVLPAPLRDDGRAGELLEPLADAAEPGAGRLAALLATQAGERQRLAREIERVARERAATDKERDKREEALREQLEALRAIERGILEREEKLRKRQR